MIMIHGQSDVEHTVCWEEAELDGVTNNGSEVVGAIDELAISDADLEVGSGNCSGESHNEGG